MKENFFLAIIFKTGALALVLVVMLPTAVKLSHTFEHQNHTHQVCEEDNSSKTHFHQTDIDCDFHKFKLTKQYFFQNEVIYLTSIKNNFKIIESQYEFVSDFQKLQTALRGPPQMI